VASGANISQTINSPTLNLSLPAPSFGAPGRERYVEWREVIDEIHESVEQMGYALCPSSRLRRTMNAVTTKQVFAGEIAYLLRSRILIAETIQKSG